VVSTSMAFATATALRDRSIDLRELQWRENLGAFNDILRGGLGQALQEVTCDDPTVHRCREGPASRFPRPFETANPTKQFLTRGRQSPEHVAAFALRKFDTGRVPTVIPGAANHLIASGYRVTPRALMPFVAEHYARAG
jgi:hypothetical protein